MKKCMIRVFLTILLLNSLCYAEVNIVNEKYQNATEVSNSNFEYKIDNKISRELKEAIEDVYGKEKTDEIYQTIIAKAMTSIKLRSENLKQQDLTRKSDWYKEEIIYMFYVDQFGVVQQNKPNTFKDTTQMLDYLKELGVTTLYMLPFKFFY